MTMTDPVSDLLTRIRNASEARHETVDVPSSKLKLEITRILKEEGYISNFILVQDNKQGVIRIQLRYAAGKNPGNYRLSIESAVRVAESMPGNPKSPLCWEDWAFASFPRRRAFLPESRRRKRD